MEWYTIYIQQSSAVMTFWNVYIAVSLGIIGFVIQKQGTLSKKDKIIIMLGFTLFAASNLYPMFEAQRSLANMFCELPKTQKVFNEPSVWPLVFVHIIFDALILLFLNSKGAKND